MSQVITQVVVDADLRAKLHDLDRDMVFVDETGRRLGRFVPEAAPPFAPPHTRQSLYTSEESASFDPEDEGPSIAEIWTDLGGGY